MILNFRAKNKKLQKRYIFIFKIYKIQCMFVCSLEVDVKNNRPSEK